MRSLPDFEDMEFNPISEKIVDALVSRTQSDMRNFFRGTVTYQLCVMASMMKCSTYTVDRGTIPINGYVVNLSLSGSGKTMANNIIEDAVVNRFKEKFIDKTFQSISSMSLTEKADKRALLVDGDCGKELENLNKEFEEAGELPYDYDSGTVPAFKQVRHKCLLAGVGSLNLIVDEIGSMLESSGDLLDIYLASYDLGKVKQKLIKNTKESIRAKEIVGSVPSNMLLFGTQDRLLDGGKVQALFEQLLETGYARRCFFGYSDSAGNGLNLTAEEIYEKALNGITSDDLEEISKKFEELANISNFNRTIPMSKEVNIQFIEYRLKCEKRAESIPTHMFTKAAEMSHRFFKTLKLAGTYAFIEGNKEITEANLHSAIKYSEESGEAFIKIMSSDKPHIKLAKYILESEEPVTKADFIRDLPLYTGNESYKKELLSLAKAYGHKNNITIISEEVEDIVFYSGESIQETNLDEMIFSYSEDITTGYINDTQSFSDLKQLFCMGGLHFVNHHLEEKDYAEIEEEDEEVHYVSEEEEEELQQCSESV